MRNRRVFFYVPCISAISLWAITTPANGFVAEGRWEATASSPSGEMGDPVTLTWSVVPDGTVIQGEGVSNLVQFFDGMFGAGASGGDDLTHRPWFSLLAEPFDRWSQLSGMTFHYEPHDDGPIHGSAAGDLGVRGDVRIGGAQIDEAGGTLAYIYYPSNSDLVIDTADAAFFGNAALDYRPFRNTLVHELGHGFGLAHVVSNSDAFLMEPAINITFDGPQLDDIRGIHAFYGDALEKTNGGAGNDTPATATSLGVMHSGAFRSVGSDAAPDTHVEPSDVDFVSIANNTDSDFFSFEVKRPIGLNAMLTPRGGIFNHGVQGGSQSQINANADGDLRMSIFGSDGQTMLASADHRPAGDTESLSGVYLPAAGQYFVQVTGESDAVQLYQLDLSLVAAASLLRGDFNYDGEVDAADYVVWRKSLAERGIGLAADANYDLIVDDTDYRIWRQNVGLTAASAAAAYLASVPEPGSCMLAALAALITLRRTRPTVSERV
jgi:serralysin